MVYEGSSTYLGRLVDLCVFLCFVLEPWTRLPQSSSSAPSKENKSRDVTTCFTLEWWSKRTVATNDMVDLPAHLFWIYRENLGMLWRSAAFSVYCLK